MHPSDFLPRFQGPLVLFFYPFSLLAAAFFPPRYLFLLPPSNHN